jgi:Dyp-type peroxidase family
MIMLNNDKPINPNDLMYDKLLDNLQGNILKGHGRDFTHHIFVKFDKNKIRSAKKWIKAFSDKITSCKQQLKDRQNYKKSNIPGRTFFGFYISSSGYEVLEGSHYSKSFLKSMKMAELNDPEVSKWETGYKEDIHAMILIAADDLKKIKNEAFILIDELNRFSSIQKTESGNVLRNDENDGIEHFRYADGISQPLFLEDEVMEYHDKYKGKEIKYDPWFSLSQVLLPDPFVKDKDAFGSFLVFRKLEQNVYEFKKQEKRIAKHLGMNDDEGEEVGAALVGRFEDGTPHVLSKKEGIFDNLTNNFDFKGSAGKCPFLSHIQATNERTKETRSIVIARRGIPYGTESSNGHFYPKKDVGLLFMAFQSNIEMQFEKMQMHANTNGDLIIGQTHHAVDVASTCFGNGNSRENSKADVFVKLKGGEYFFAPSIPYLKNIKIE